MPPNKPSLPSPPYGASAPPRPYSVSLPISPERTSAPPPPMRVSLQVLLLRMAAGTSPSGATDTLGCQHGGCAGWEILHCTPAHTRGRLLLFKQQDLRGG